MAKEVTYEFIKEIPKAELHLHLEGTLEPDLKLRLAQKNQIDIGQSTIEEVEASYQFDSLPSFLNIYYPAMNVLQTEEDFYELAMAYFKKAAEHHVTYAEVFLIRKPIPLAVFLLKPSSTAIIERHKKVNKLVYEVP